MIDALPLLLAPEGYQISRSVRLRSSASASFSRTPASATNRRSWTWSGWLKRGAISGNYGIFSAKQVKDDITGLYIGSTDKLTFIDRPSGVTNVLLQTEMVLRDPSAWYHIVLQADTPNATSSDRVKIFVNGVRVTAFSFSTLPSQNYEIAYINNTQDHRIGAFQDNTAQNLDGYLTEINFIDGQALTPSSFGESNSTTGVWQPKKYTGTYGTNGFYLNFSDNSNNTAATIGKDYSGNGNNWTPNNISVTSGATYDSMLDVPTPWADGGNGRGNYAVLNPLILNAAASMGVAGGNLNITRSSAGWASLSSTIRISSGKWYWEVLPTNNSTSQMHGIQTIEALGQYPGQVATSWGYYTSNGQKYNNGTGTAYGSAYSPSNPIGVALDMDNGRIWFSRNGVWEASGDPAAGTNAAFTGITGEVVPAFGLDSISTAASANFGQRPFSYTPPSGFRALNTLNLPEPTIRRGSDYFNIALAAGASIKSTAEALFTGDELVWVKDRANANNHQLFDTVRGLSNVLQSNTTAAETTYSAPTGNSVGWVWREGATQGFDIVTYTGTGVNRTVAHSLGVKPGLMIIKKRNAGATDWIVYSAVRGADRYLALNLTSAETLLSTVFNNTDPTSSVFSLGTASGVNANNDTYVAYLFSEVPGFSRFGSYTGNGSADGPFVFCGFRPAFLMIKRTDSTGSWFMNDDARPGYNVNTFDLQANSSGAESSNSICDFTANGFKIRIDGLQVNASGGTFVFMAFAENPFKNALAR